MFDKKSVVRYNLTTSVFTYYQSFLFQLHICSFDMRNNTKHWMASDLGEQASFFVNRTGRFTKSGVEIVQSYLQIKQVQSKDQGFYRCRVDFFQAPTRNVKVKLSLIGMYLFQEVGKL